MFTLRELKQKTVREFMKKISLPSAGFLILTAYGARLYYYMHGYRKFIVLTHGQYMECLYRFGKVTMAELSELTDWRKITRTLEKAEVITLAAEHEYDLVGGVIGIQTAKIISFPGFLKPAA